ncbi:TPA: hypothetical protein DEG21_04685 [Patescibacteria group bacterium]|nr:hypothetical protein [Candidatus Gracilibacteria bacterium]HBY75130.1 hypothetical protein [Candidatus Gracilibacteria bacterium]
MSLKEHLDISKEQKTSKDRYLCPFSMISTREIVTSILKFDPKIRPSYIIEERFILERIKENNK